MKIVVARKYEVRIAKFVWGQRKYGSDPVRTPHNVIITQRYLLGIS
jgi:hypothetical protein